MKKRIVVLSGAGISAESGIQTFRDSDGLWEGFNVNDVATPKGFERNPEVVLDFYNQRRQQLHNVKPNTGHLILAELEADFDVHIITQNVDDLHEKAGSTKVLHLHGELLKVRSTVDEKYILNWEKDLNLGDLDNNGNQLRPHIVWFGEDVPVLEKAVLLVNQADILIIIGTSLQVYPAASLMHYAPENCNVYYIDPKPAAIYDSNNTIKTIATTGSKGMKLVQNELMKMK